MQATTPKAKLAPEGLEKTHIRTAAQPRAMRQWRKYGIVICWRMHVQALARVRQSLVVIVRKYGNLMWPPGDEQRWECKGRLP
jgi:hypothetical protein